MQNMDPEGPSDFLYKRIYFELKKEILSGVYAKGAWFPPERTLKERFGTTHLTVRNALSKLVQEGYIERHSGKGTIVIYSGDRVPDPRPPLRFNQVRLLIAEPDEAGSALMLSLEERLRRIQLPLHTSLHRGSPALERSLFEGAVESGALVILRPVDSPDSLLNSGIAVPNTILVRTGRGAAPCVQFQIDLAEGAREAVRHLIDLGHREIALLSQPGSESDALREGFESEERAEGVEVDPELQTTCPGSVNSAALAASAILTRRPNCRAFFCGSDAIAAGVARALKESGLRIGVDASVIGYGNTPLAEALDLSSIDPRFGELGELIAAAIVDGMRRGTLLKDAHRIAPRLVGRASCWRLSRQASGSSVAPCGG
jgi:DNA-binding LacI/PurR family transcriptional regulator/DNA-binding transcriptional regulator YhcF (GntR family)